MLEVYPHAQSFEVLKVQVSGISAPRVSVKTSNETYMNLIWEKPHHHHPLRLYV